MDWILDESQLTDKWLHINRRTRLDLSLRHQRTSPAIPTETSFLPVMLFAIVFGLSMDYQVFLVSRIHEEWVKTGNSRLAVRNGPAATGKTISAAALIMILVFGSFVLGGEIVIKEFGLGLAGGILATRLERILPNFDFEENEAPTSIPETKPSDGDERSEALEPIR